MADDRSIAHDWQVNPIPPTVPVTAIQWHGPENLGGDGVEVVAAQNEDGHLEMIYTDVQNVIFHNWQTSPNGTWATYPESKMIWTFPSPNRFALQAEKLALILDGTGCLELFFTDGNDIYQIKQSIPNNGWDLPIKFGGGVKAQEITVELNQNDCLELFYVGEDNNLYHNRQSMPGSTVWEGEVKFEEGMGKQIAVGRNADGCLEIFYTGMGDHLYRNRQSQPNSYVWEGEVKFEEDKGKQIIVANNLDRSLELFYIGTNDGIYHNRQSAPSSRVWNGEERFENDEAKKLAIGRNEDGRLELFYVGTNSRLYHNWQQVPGGSDWNGEVPFNPPATASNLAVASNQDGRLEVFYFDVDKETFPFPDPGNNASDSGLGTE